MSEEDLEKEREEVWKEIRVMLKVGVYTAFVMILITLIYSVIRGIL